MAFDEDMPVEIRYVYCSTSTPNPTDAELQKTVMLLRRENARLLREIHQLRTRRK
jgi:hypothetical protein